MWTVQPLRFPPFNQSGCRFSKSRVLVKEVISVVSQDSHSLWLTLKLDVADGPHHDYEDLVGTRSSVHSGQSRTLYHANDYLVVMEDAKIHCVTFKYNPDCLNIDNYKCIKQCE